MRESLALNYFRPMLESQHVLVRTDNTAVVSHTKQLWRKTFPPQLLELTRSLLLWS